MLKRLLELGGKEWKKGDYHRVYFNENQLLEFYGIHFDGKEYNDGRWKVSKREANRVFYMLSAGKFWFDLVSGEFGAKDFSEATTQKLIDGINEALLNQKAEVEEIVKETIVENAEVEVIAKDVMTATGPGIAKADVRANNKSGRCRVCGGHVKAGEGHLYYIDPDEAYGHSGWVVEHKDKSQCQKQMYDEANLYR